jgi:hypothetical protein
MPDKHPSVKNLIIQYLQEKRTPQYKGHIEDHIRLRASNHNLTETTGRRCRDLVKEGRIEKLEDDAGNTMYKLKVQIVNPTTPIKVDKEVIQVASLF